MIILNWYWYDAFLNLFFINCFPLSFCLVGIERKMDRANITISWDYEYSIQIKCKSGLSDCGLFRLDVFNGLFNCLFGQH